MKVVKLRVYKGSEVLYDAKGNVKNQNQYVKLIHGTLEWKNYLRYIKMQGYCKIQVITLIDLKTKKELDTKEVQAEIDIANSSDNKVPLTKEQAEIAELRELVAELKIRGEQAEEVETEDEEEIEEIEKEVDPELEALKAEYEEVLGKKPHHKLTVENIKKAIEENK